MSERDTSVENTSGNTTPEEETAPAVGSETDALSSAPSGDSSSAASKEGNSGRRIWAEIKSWFRDLIIAVIICVILIVYIVQPFRVEKTSMEPLLHEGDRILVSKISLLYEPIKRGDVVVLWNPRNPEESWIKRVIGLPGEEVRIDDGVVFIDGVALEEHYLPEGTIGSRYDYYPPEEAELLTRDHRRLMNQLLGFSMRLDSNPGDEVLVQRVPDGHYFVLGDNRNHSMDSRASVFEPESGGPGMIPEKYIYGKAIFRYWPLNKIGTIPAGKPELPAE